MYLLIMDRHGKSHDAFLLAGGEDWARLAMRGAGDALSLTLSGGRWRSDAGEAFEIASVMLSEEEQHCDPAFGRKVRAAC